MDRAKLGKYSKEKGKRGEREVAKILRSYGFDARRTAQYCGKTGDASDVVGIDGFHIEVKFVEKLNIWNAVKQAERDADAEFVNHDTVKKPVVIYRKTQEDWHCILGIDDFVELVQAYLILKEIEKQAMKNHLEEDIDINDINGINVAHETIIGVERELFDSNENE